MTFSCKFLSHTPGSIRRTIANSSEQLLHSHHLTIIQNLYLQNTCSLSSEVNFPLPFGFIWHVSNLISLFSLHLGRRTTGFNSYTEVTWVLQFKEGTESAGWVWLSIPRLGRVRPILQFLFWPNSHWNSMPSKNYWTKIFKGLEGKK